MVFDEMLKVNLLIPVPTYNMAQIANYVHYSVSTIQKASAAGLLKTVKSNPILCTHEQVLEFWRFIQEHHDEFSAAIKSVNKGTKIKRGRKPGPRLQIAAPTSKR